MKRVLCLFSIIVFIIIFIWSQYVGLALNSQVLPKKLSLSPIEGSWTVDRYVYIGDSKVDSKKTKQLIGKVAYFSKATVDFNGNTSKDPKYKVKSVDAKSYFWNVIKISAKTLGIKNTNVEIITINSNDIFFDEYIKLDNLTLIKYYDGLLLYFHKTKDSDSTISANIDKENDTKILISKAEKEIKSKSGLLLGLKYKNPNINPNQSKYLYKTLWISSINNKILPITQTKDLLLPRQNGFWKVGISKKIENGTYKDVFWSYPINNSNPINPISKQIKYSKTEDGMDINFLGSNYVSLNIANNDTINRFKTLPMDNLLGESVKLSMIFGSEMENSILSTTLLNNSKNIKDENRKNIDTNWGVIRRSGRWILRGKMEGKINSQHPFTDFDISYATPKVLTTYDDLFPSFNAIKTIVPSAIDAYSSPNRDFIVVLTTTELKVFNLNGDTLGENPLTLKLTEGETPVMSHWATGNYVDQWQKKVK